MGGLLLDLQRRKGETLQHMVNDIIRELMDLEMEPKPEPLWWTSTYDAEVGATEVGRGKNWEMPFLEEFRRNGKGIQGTERTLKKGMGSWSADSHICRAKSR